MLMIRAAGLFDGERFLPGPATVVVDDGRSPAWIRDGRTRRSTPKCSTSATPCSPGSWTPTSTSSATAAGVPGPRRGLLA